MQYLYQIAGISVLCKIPFQVHIRQESADFIYSLCEGSRKPELTICFYPVDELEPIPPGGHWDIDRCHVPGSIYYCASPKGKPYARMKNDPADETQLLCEYIRGKESYLNYSRNLCDIILLDTLLLNHDGLLLHASFIRWNQKGILFSAPSGAGKSTQAELWAKYEDAEIINGDRAGLRLIDGRWNAYGLPYAGSSGIYRNESAEAEAIIVLRQAKENRIRQLGPAESMRYLYPELTIHHWDRVFTERAMSLLAGLVTTVPVYLLECLPDRGAVQLVKQTAFEKKRKGG